MDLEPRAHMSQEELTLGVRRRRVVLAVLIALMSGAAILSLVLFAVLAPVFDRAASRGRTQLTAASELSDALSDRHRSLTAWVLAGQDSYRAQAAQASTRADDAAATL